MYFYPEGNKEVISVYKFTCEQVGIADWLACFFRYVVLFARNVQLLGLLMRSEWNKSFLAVNVP